MGTTPQEPEPPFNILFFNISVASGLFAYLFAMS